MALIPRSMAVLLALLPAVLAARGEKTIRFSGYDWTVREVQLAGPGPNRWDARNAFVDPEGRLHLKITNRDGAWCCGEVVLAQRLGFGDYQFDVVGRPDLFDPQVVLGLFNYTRPDVGPDGTNEIDVEFTRWVYAPDEPGKFIPQKPLPVQINFWVVRGRPPKDGREAEVIIRRFFFRPMEAR